MDGDLGDWEGPPAAVLDDAAQVRPRDDWKGPDDLSGAVRLAWDGECLYVGVEVKDQHFRQEHTGVMTWAGDSIQVAADPLPGERQEYHQMSMDYTKKFSEYILALTTNGPSVYRSGSWDRRRPVGPVGPQDVRLAVRRTDNGLVYEAAFSWESLSMERPDPGRAIGLALTLNDRDEADGPFQGMEWFGGILYAKDPDKFGQVVLQP